jgi:26S proteasome regulatory subunit T3
VASSFVEPAIPNPSASLLYAIMGDVLIENPANSLLLHKKQPPSDSIPNIESLEGSGSDGGDEYSTLKRYQRHLE